MSRPPSAPRRRDPVAKSLPRLSGGGLHRTDPTRANLKRELRRRVMQSDTPERNENARKRKISFQDID